MPALALGALAFELARLTKEPPFANLEFGDRSRMLVAQLSRGNYAFAVDQSKSVHGFTTRFTTVSMRSRLAGHAP